MRAVLPLLALLPASALATITITGPSASQYWVQNTSNTISWTSTAEDPATVDVIVTNADNATLNGDFFIQRSLNTSTGFTVITNVTLKVGSGFQVVFVNDTNPNQVFANSSDFSVMSPGTAPAPTSSASSPNASATSPSGIITGTSTSTGTASPSTTSSAASPNVVASSSSVFFALGACALTAVSAVFL